MLLRDAVGGTWKMALPNTLGYTWDGMVADGEGTRPNVAIDIDVGEVAGTAQHTWDSKDIEAVNHGRMLGLSGIVFVHQKI